MKKKEALCNGIENEKIGNNVGDEGVKMINEGLKRNSTLTALHLCRDERGIRISSPSSLE